MADLRLEFKDKEQDAACTKREAYLYVLALLPAQVTMSACGGKLQMCARLFETLHARAGKEQRSITRVLCVQVAREAFGSYLAVVRQAVLDAASTGAARAAGLRPPPEGADAAAEQLPGAG